jgi:3-deoxy-D-manno-octulosonate 8-phosphate phosphatase (KDO 8-P phosphatase)
MSIIFVLDLDGVLTDGKFYYSKEGKEFKSFGPDDHDALKEIQERLEVVVVTADALGFEISQRRVEQDMGIKLFLVNAKERANWIHDNYPNHYKIYMGDGYYDEQVFKTVDLAIAPSNALKHTQQMAHHVTSRSGGDRAVAEACIYILEKLFSS